MATCSNNSYGITDYAPFSFTITTKGVYWRCVGGFSVQTTPIDKVAKHVAAKGTSTTMALAFSENIKKLDRFIRMLTCFIATRGRHHDWF